MNSFDGATHPGGAPPVYRVQDESDTRRAGQPEAGHAEEADLKRRRYEQRAKRDAVGMSKEAMFYGFADELLKLSSALGKAIHQKQIANNIWSRRTFGAGAPGLPNNAQRARQAAASELRDARRLGGSQLGKQVRTDMINNTRSRTAKTLQRSMVNRHFRKGWSGESMN